MRAGRRKAATTIDAGSGQGMQVGKGNVQYNAWTGTAPLTAASLTLLSPEAALARLQKMSHDAIVDLFAEADSSGGWSELIRLLVDADEAKTVSVLADLNLKKTAKLLTPIEAELPWLKVLPAAAESIA